MTGRSAAPDLRQTRRDPAQGPPDFPMRFLAPGMKENSPPGDGQQGGEKRSRPKVWNAGLTGAMGDEVVHGIFSGGTGPSGGQRAGAGAGALRERTPAIHGDIGFRLGIDTKNRLGAGAAEHEPRTIL